MQLSTGRTATGLLHCFGVGVWGARPFVSRIQGVSPCTTSSLPSPIPRLASPHPYPRSSALQHFFYRSLHSHTYHHTSPRALPRCHLWCRLSSWTVSGYTYASLPCMVVPSPPTTIHLTMIDHTPHPAGTPPIRQNNTHTHTQVTPLHMQLRAVGYDTHHCIRTAASFTF